MTEKLLALLIVCFLCSCNQQQEVNPVDYRVHTFYYNWYGAPPLDKEYSHWNHDILPHWSDTTWNNAGGFPGGDDIGANYFPALGNYSSRDESVIEKHFEWIKSSGIGVIAITWWGKDSFEDSSVKKYLDIANRHGLKLVFHIEPFYKTAAEFKEQLTYLNSQYAEHPAIFELNGKPFYYVYDSYKLQSDEWAKLLTETGDLSLRNSDLDATFIGIWVHKDEGQFFIDSGFDGYYTYFASDGFVYGSTSTNWPQLAEFAEQNNLLFIPCAGPGYIDTRIRPWNGANTKDRNGGEYYERMFSRAVGVNPDFIGITSFNEWHEGTQIEPSIPKSIPSFSYEDFEQGEDSLFYIKLTKELISRP